MPEYQIIIGPKSSAQNRPTRPPSRLDILKAALLGILGLAMVVGILIAAFVVGSIIASVILILLAAALIAFLVRQLLRKLKTMF